MLRSIVARTAIAAAGATLLLSSAVRADDVKLPSSLTFSTGAPEVMEGTGGSCEYKLDGSSEWVAAGAGEKFSVPGNSKFEIRVTGAPYSYICHFG